MATSLDVRRENRSAVLRTVRRRGISSRADIAAESGMSLATLTRIVDELVNEKLVVVEEPEQRSSMGRPTRKLALDLEVERYLLVEVGPRRTRLFVTAANFENVPLKQVEFKTPNNSKAWLSEITVAIKSLALPPTVRFAIVSLPGMVDEAASRVLLSPNLHWSENFDFKSVLSELTGAATVHVLQETRALALGHLELNPNSESFLLVDFGTGLGSAAMVDGKSYRGNLPLSGEVGHTLIPGNDLACGCGAKGCLETLVGRRAILKKLGTEDFSALSASLDSNGLPDWLLERIDAAGGVIAGALNVLGLNRLIVTGYFEELPEVAFERLVKAVMRGAMWARFGNLRVAKASRQRMAGLAVTAFEDMLRT